MANPNPAAAGAAAAGALAGPQLAQALNDHDRAKRSTDIPLYYGQPGRDTIAARLLIVRINDAGAIAGWDNACKLLEFKMCLRDKAVGWFEGLIEERINVDTGISSKLNSWRLTNRSTPQKQPAPTLLI